MKYLSIFIRVALLALRQSLDCHSASEVSLMDMGNQSMYNHNKAQQSKNRVHISWDIQYMTHELKYLHKYLHLIRLLPLSKMMKNHFRNCHFITKITGTIRNMIPHKCSALWMILKKLIRFRWGIYVMLLVTIDIKLRSWFQTIIVIYKKPCIIPLLLDTCRVWYIINLPVMIIVT